ncbi:hypothetical protein BGZ61DRAFT_559911 [Ilyonectria robusta]|uniref:uncharacterized protein n=1 Tax=Ilyonectria robusta TaxID=1079257 RepID=UPI001E8EF2C8|nr:uncharacterized protein BGZ61DRAFT_559911 [Ilyonectria robusta]KAH8734311.1 hypothetical protein BGZ61DRAFT_559911 [Ilyonectria robusta]
MTPSYKDFVALRTRLNPCLSGLAEHLGSEPRNASTTVVIDCHGQSPSEPVSVAEADFSWLVNVKSQTTRLVFIENISPRLISLVGEMLDVDPIFFANHVNTDLKDIEKSPPPPSVALLPSLISEKGHLHLHYQQVMSLGSAERFKEVAYSLKSDSNIQRNIRRLPPLSGKQLVLARACCSVFVKQINESYICLFLVDPPINAAIDTSKELKKTYPVDPLHGGFEDFGPSSSFSSFSSFAGKSNDIWDNTSMFSSLLHYYRTYPPGFIPTKPTILGVGYYPVRIVLSEWSVYTLLISRYFKYYEYSLQDMTNRLHDNDIVDLQRWRRRSKQSQNKLSMLAKFIDYWTQREDDRQHWEMVLDDIQHVRQQLEYYSQSLEQIVMVATSMVQLFDSRRSILEAINVRRLTYIALIFVPLSWVASLFSMSDTYSPGHENFWVYFATALPLVVVVLLLSAIPYDRMKEALRRIWDWFASVNTRKLRNESSLA